MKPLTPLMSGLLLATSLLTSCDELSGTLPQQRTEPTNAKEALTYDVSFTALAVTSRIIIQNQGGCDTLSGGWVDSAGISNLLFVGDPQYQKWAEKDTFRQDTVAMAMFYDREFQFVFACKQNGKLNYHSTKFGVLDKAFIEKQGHNLLLRSVLKDGQVVFEHNFKFEDPQ